MENAYLRLDANGGRSFPPPAALAALAKKGIKIRTWPDRPGREGLIRITCPGNEAEVGILLAAIEKIGRQ